MIEYNQKYFIDNYKKRFKEYHISFGINQTKFQTPKYLDPSLILLEFEKETNKYITQLKDDIPIFLSFIFINFSWIEILSKLAWQIILTSEYSNKS